MKKAERNALIATVVVIVVGALVAWAGCQGSAQVLGMPLYAVLVAGIFLIQWIVFIPAYMLQSERFFDLTGSLTYITTTLLALALSSNAGTRSVLLTALVVVWAGRLGAFLFRRVKKAGKDDRFDEIKPSFLRFLNVWTIQALWITLTAAAAHITISSTLQKPLDVFALVGFLVWAAGFAIEISADRQKSRFNADPANKGKFIATGLWARSRHPNYFGEILLWAGVAIIALPVLRGWQWVGLISPFFVTLLLTRVSGIPLLEQKADRKWGGQADYEAYKRKTPVLIPRL
jgi:steroid 5-alpha reductase family enzyme